MLYAKRNQAYADDEELAKKKVVDRTLLWVKTLHPDTEVSIQPTKMSSQLKYGYDSLFEAFKSAIEQVLSASLNNELTTQKNYEIIRKYNQLSSYLKNIVAINKLTPEDEEIIKKDFDDIKPKLEELKQIAIDNDFSDVNDIIEMVNKINQASTPKSEFIKVGSKSEGMIQKIKTKNEAVDALSKMDSIIETIDNDLNDKSKIELDEQIIDNFKISLENLKQQYESYANKDITSSDYATITNNYNNLLKLQNKINKYKSKYNDEVDKLNLSITEIDKQYNNDYFQSKVREAYNIIKDNFMPKVSDDNFITSFNQSYKKQIPIFEKEFDGIKNEWLQYIKIEQDKMKNKEMSIEDYAIQLKKHTNELKQNLYDWYDAIKSVIENAIDSFNQQIIDEGGQKVDVKDIKEEKKDEVVIKIKKSKPPKPPKEIKQSKKIYTNSNDFLKAFNAAVALNQEDMKNTGKKTPNVFKTFKSKSTQSVAGSYFTNYKKLSDTEKENYFEKK